jgi:hypothetical protein
LKLESPAPASTKSALRMAVTAEQGAISYVINALFNALPSMVSLTFVWAVLDLVKQIIFVPIEVTRIVVCYFFVTKRTVCLKYA